MATWYEWVEGTTSSTASTVTYSDYTWVTWSDGTEGMHNSGTKSVVYNNCTWHNWSDSSTTGVDFVANSDLVWYYLSDECYSEPLEEVRVDINERERRYKEQEKKKEDAELKAKDLLLDLIGKEELKVYEETGRVFVKGKKFDYIVQKSGYVKRIEKSKITDMCVHLKDQYKYPPTDNVIAVKTALEQDEDNILEMANYWGSSDKPKELPKAACM